MAANEVWTQALSGLEDAIHRAAQHGGGPGSVPQETLIELRWRAAVVMSLLESSLAEREREASQKQEKQQPIFANLAETDFPFTVEIVDEESCAVIDRYEVDGPGALVLKGYAPHKVTIVTTFPNVRVTTDSRGNITQEEL